MSWVPLSLSFFLLIAVFVTFVIIKLCIQVAQTRLQGETMRKRRVAQSNPERIENYGRTAREELLLARPSFEGQTLEGFTANVRVAER